jgi:hypothetical protein
VTILALLKLVSIDVIPYAIFTFVTPVMDVLGIFESVVGTDEG